MKYLLDTMVWLWSVGPSRTIGAAGLEIIASSEQDIYLSAASSWEIAIKTRLGKFQLPEPPGQYVRKRLVEQGIRSLPINLNHSLLVYDLPSHHADPFDRMLICQSMTHDLAIVTPDPYIARYPIRVLW